MGSILSIDDRLKIMEKWNPRKAEELRLAYLLEDEEEGRRDVRWYIENLAEMVVIDPIYRDSSILSVPPEETAARGEIEIGNVMRGRVPAYPLKLKRQSFLKHLGLFGSTGSGKTMALYNIVRSISQNGIPILIFDFSKKNYRDLLETDLGDKISVFTVGKNTAPFRFNPLVPPDRVLPSIWSKRFAEIQDHSYVLLGGARHIVMKALEDLYHRHGVYSGSKNYPTISEVRDWVENYEKKRLTFRERNWVSSAKRSLISLSSRETGDIFVRKGIKPEQLLKGITILELDGLNEENRVFFIEIILQYLRDWLLENWEKERIAGVIVLEEAHHVLNREKSKRIGSETVMDLLFREVRELGIGIIFADQMPSKVSYSALENSNTQVYMKLNLDSKSDSNITDASKMLGLKDEEIDYLKNLEVGQGIVKSDVFHKPFMIGFPEMAIRKGSVTDEKLMMFMKDKLGEIYGGDYLDNEERKDVELNEIELEIIKALGERGTLSITAMRGVLNTSSIRVKECFDILINNGYVESRETRVHTNRVMNYSLTEKGREFFREVTGMDAARKNPETLHQQMKDFVIEKYTGERCTVGDSNIGTGYVDVLLERDGKIAKIEIETGENSDEWLCRNIDKCVRVKGATCFLCANEKVKERVLEQAKKYRYENNKRFGIFVLTFGQLKKLERGQHWKEYGFP